jgi:uncharacterized membrane protein YraQ (UPF0718 family)
MNESTQIVFSPGRMYRRRELHEKFGGQRQGGISTPAKAPFIFLTWRVRNSWDLFRPVNEWLSTGVAILGLVGNWFPESWYKMAHTSIALFFGVYCLLIGYLILVFSNIHRC